MRKSIKLVGAMALMGVLAFSTSCKKNDQTSSASVSMPKIQEINVDSERAYIDYDDGNQMKWEDGDEIMIYNLHRNYRRSEREVYTIEEGYNNATHAMFEGNPMHLPYGDGYLVFYPAEKVYGDLQEGNRQDFVVPTEQKYAFGDFMRPRVDSRALVMAGKVAQLDEESVLSHIFGFANFRIRGEYLADQYRNQRVRSVVLHTNNIHISGNVSVKLPGVDPDQLNDLITQASEAQTEEQQAAYWEALTAYLYSDEVGYNSYDQGFEVTLNCEEAMDGQGVLLGDQVTHFLFSLRPGCLFDGFTVTFNFMDDSLEPLVITKYENPDYRYCIVPGVLKNFNCNFNNNMPNN